MEVSFSPFYSNKLLSLNGLQYLGEPALTLPRQCRRAGPSGMGTVEPVPAQGVRMRKPAPPLLGFGTQVSWPHLCQGSVKSWPWWYGCRRTTSIA